MSASRRKRRWRLVRGYAGGTFDLLHYGHINFLQRCRQQCDHLTVSLNDDDFAARYKRPPIYPLDQRMEILRELRSVDDVIVNHGGPNSRPAISEAKADVIFHGDDWPVGDLLRQLGLDAEYMRSHDLTLKYIPYTEGVSTSDTIRRCRQSQLS